MDEFAPLYTTRERIYMLLKILAVAAPVYLLAQFWFFPWLVNYASFSNCYRYGSITGTHLLMYGVFVFIPLSLALVIWLLEGRRCLKVLAAGQTPLPGEKVFRKTRYKYGRAAMFQPIMLFFVTAAIVGISIWGGFQAEKMTRSIAPCSDQQFRQLNNQLN
ncbi:MAG: hypothetical protein OEU50_20415 [Gammaproteobacteria bacterium]|nr:hypothetical protein [Gammaproteobacteria bacterium]